MPGLSVETPPHGPDDAFRRRVASAFALMDRHGHGLLSRIDVIQALRADGNEYLHDMLQLPHHIRQEDGTRDEFNHLFRAIDANETDNISLEEWERWCYLQQPGAPPPPKSPMRRRLPEAKRSNPSRRQGDYSSCPPSPNPQGATSVLVADPSPDAHPPP